MWETSSERLLNVSSVTQLAMIRARIGCEVYLTPKSMFCNKRSFRKSISQSINQLNKTMKKV